MESKKFSWDEQLSLEIISRRNIIQQELQILQSSTFARYIGFPKDEKCTYQLFAFCDASKMHMQQQYICIGIVDQCVDLT